VRGSPSPLVPPIFPSPLWGEGMGEGLFPLLSTTLIKRCSVSIYLYSIVRLSSSKDTSNTSSNPSFMLEMRTSRGVLS